MAEVINSNCELLDNQKVEEPLNDENNSHDNNVTKSEALETKVYSDVEMSVEVDGNVDSSKPTETSTGDVEIVKLLTEEEMQRKRKRGKRGGRKRGFGAEEKNDLHYSHGEGFGPRMQNMQRGEKRGFRDQDTTNVADLTKLPNGILLVEDGDYVGYHCTYCNCVLTSMSTVNDHVAGFRHEVILEVRNIVKKKKEGNVPQCKSESSAEQLQNEDDKTEAVQNDENEETVQTVESEPEPTSTKDVSLPLKSSLEDKLVAVSDPVIGLDYIIEKRTQSGDASFECKLCKLELFSEGMKSHITGTRHRLMYLKTKEPQKITELMTKNLQKAERNKIIKDYIETLMQKHGKGSIIVEYADSTATTDKTEKRKRSGAQRRKRRRQEPSNPPPPPLKTTQIIKTSKSKQTNNDNTASKSSKSKRGNNYNTASKSSKSKRGNFYGTRQKRAANYGANSSRKRQHETPSPWLQPFGAQQISREFASNAPWMQPYTHDQFSRDVIANNVYNAGSSFGSGQYSSNYNKSRQLFQNEDNRRMDYSSNYSHPSSYLSQDHTTRNREQGTKTDLLQELRKKPDIDVTNEEEAGVIMNVINSLTERFLQYKLKNIASPAKKILEKSLKDETLQHVLGSLTDENNVRPANRISSKINAHNRDINDKSNRALARDIRDQPQCDWKEDREPIYTRDKRAESLDYFDEKRGTAYHRETMNKSSFNWDEERERESKLRENFEDNSDTAHCRARMNQSLNNWDEIRDTAYPKDRMYKSQNTFDNIGDGTYHKDRRSQREWNEDMDLSKPNNIGDGTYRKDKMNQSRHEWNEDKAIKHPRDIMDWSKPDCNETKDTTYARDVMNQLQRDWNENRSTSHSKDVIDQTRYNWNDNKDATSRNMIDQPQYEWNEVRDTTSTRDVTDQYQHGWNKTRLAREGNRNINSLHKSFHSSNELKQAGMMKNITSKFSETRYGSSRNSGSFNNPPRTWNLKDSTQQKNSTSSYASYPSQMQSSSIASLTLHKNTVHPSYVDDLFDKYQKEMKGDKTRSTTTNMDLKSHSHTVSSFKSSSNYMGSSGMSSFNRPSGFGQLSSAASAAKWKYTSFK